ncbi:MAG: GDP-mannose 4,6-dehydratase [Thermoplasmata archaeon]|nr:MAG: GDP-mannose 4,6-dehydratase [Thermoplasmata archaeon]
MSETKSALITGITGQDGSYLADQLLEKGYDVYGLVRRLSIPNYTRIEHILDDVTLIDGDLTDQASINRAISMSEPHEIYNLAAQSFVATSWKQPILTSEVSALGVVRILEGIRYLSPDSRMYQASSSEMFGKVQETPQTERTKFYPRSPYGISKVYGYWAVVNYRESYDLHASNGILFNHESPRRGLEFVTRKISYNVARIKLGMLDKMQLGNLDAKRDWGYAPEYTDMMWRMLQQDEPGDYVVATGESHSVREFCDVAFRHVGIDDWEGHVEVAEAHFRPAEVIDLLGDATLAKERLGWTPKVTFRELVQIMVDSDMELLTSHRPLTEPNI